MKSFFKYVFIIILTTITSLTSLFAQQSPCARAAVLKADSLFQLAIESRNVEEAVGFYDPMATTVGSAMPPAKGIVKLRDMWIRAFADTSFSFSWEIRGADVLENYEIAYTTGRWKWHMVQGDAAGIYMIVWRKDSEGSWRALIDSAWYSK